MIDGIASSAKASNTGNTEEAYLSQSGLSCLIEGKSPDERDRTRSDALMRLNLLGNDTVPVFEEATQNVSRLLAMPICILSIMDADVQRFKSVVGLSSLGLMNQLAAARSLPKHESFCTHVIDSGKTFVLQDATLHPAFSRSLLVQQYGLQSYLGVPLMTAEGCCIGTLAVMDLLPHEFTPQEIAFLELSARWSMSEFEKQQLMASQLTGHTRHPSGQSEQNYRQQSTASDQPNQSNSGNSTSRESTLLSRVNQVRFDLIVQLTQDLRSPLTSVTGMASMLSREIYGPLSEKQQEYAKIVLSSSQQLLSMVNEIVEIGDLQEEDYRLLVTSADIEMVGQQALSALADIAKQQDLQTKLTVEPGSRIWTFDKRVVKQLIYHLVFSLIKMSTAGSTVRLHISRKDDSANIALWVSNPWLGEDLPQAVITWDKANAVHVSQVSDQITSPASAQVGNSDRTAGFEWSSADASLDSREVFEVLATAQKVDASRQELGLLLSQHLTEMHGGSASVQGSAAAGYRYIITLPSLPLSH